MQRSPSTTTSNQQPAPATRRSQSYQVLACLADSCSKSEGLWRCNIHVTPRHVKELHHLQHVKAWHLALTYDGLSQGVDINPPGDQLSVSGTVMAAPSIDRTRGLSSWPVKSAKRSGSRAACRSSDSSARHHILPSSQTSEGPPSPRTNAEPADAHKNWQTLCTRLWGGFSVDNATLNRFYSLCSPVEKQAAVGTN